ncbi:hypothetical protein FRB95_011090 [Tulasnella sp. JGI-2019a]|nr:hypothetical protein FRB95_011090 [Tulasnella sp. JGI-2019a]
MELDATIPNVGSRGPTADSAHPMRMRSRSRAARLIEPVWPPPTAAVDFPWFSTEGGVKRSDIPQQLGYSWQPVHGGKTPRCFVMRQQANSLGYELGFVNIKKYSES